MRYSLDQLEVFVLVTQTGGFSATARKLGKTQSTISCAISNLEADLGVQLFDRGSKQPVLTSAGKALLPHAREILARCSELDGHAGSLNLGEETELTLTIEVPYGILVTPLREFAQRYPHINLTMRHHQAGNASALVQEGMASLGIGFAQRNYPDELAFTQLGRLVLTHVVAHDHPLARQGVIGFADLHIHRRLAFSAHFHSLPTSEYLHATCCWQAESYLALLDMAKAGLGWTSLPRQMILGEIERGELVELDLAAYPHTDWEVGIDLLWKKSSALGPAAVWLKNRIAQQQIFERGAS